MSERPTSEAATFEAEITPEEYLKRYRDREIYPEWIALLVSPLIFAGFVAYFANVLYEGVSMKEVQPLLRFIFYVIVALWVVWEGKEEEEESKKEV
ncbi:hypothetical protein L596_020084 [Steinernema carpocapsae]|uniref:Uncharacterized protein n=1 Tax=Steinernema carpocapsae TaxID=34508 RepID=A0A4U5MSI3_STECR|nr:hypothetical protein L596_020084 [Steinernema carpocapsae]